MTNSCAKSDLAAINEGMVVDAPTDTDLLRRYVQDGSEKAFTEFVQRHLGLVYRVALRKSGGNRPLAEDVAQRVFTLVTRKAAVLTNHQTLFGWLL
jgi:DNA-directed RNA polymerase specialized sigma24 family protein